MVSGDKHQFSLSLGVEVQATFSLRPIYVRLVGWSVGWLVGRL